MSQHLAFGNNISEAMRRWKQIVVDHWKEGAVLSLFREAGRLKRLPSFLMQMISWLPQPKPRTSDGRWSIVARLDRSGPEGVMG